MSCDYTITDLAQEFDVTPRTLRYYEEKGLLSPQRNGSHRIYTGTDRTRLVLILRGRSLGLSLQESADLIAMYDPASGNQRQLEALIDKIHLRRAQLESQRQELERMLEDLNAWEQRSRALLGDRPGKPQTHGAANGERA